MSHRGALLGGLALIASACSARDAAPPTAAASASVPPSAVASTAPSGAATPGASSALDAAAAAAASSTWQQTLAAAKGQTVNWYMWGGDPLINQYVSGYMNDQAQQAGVTINEVQIGDTVDAVNKVLGEKAAGKNDNGSVDLIWINGENFTTMVQSKTLDCGWVDGLPNSQLVDYTNPRSTPTSGCRSAAARRPGHLPSTP